MPSAMDDTPAVWHSVRKTDAGGNPWEFDTSIIRWNGAIRGGLCVRDASHAGQMAQSVENST
jgi:hypothetical protein